MEELDNILHEQIILAHRRLKQIKRLYKIMPDDRHLPELENMVQKKIQFLNDMMSEKQKKRKRKINIKRTFKHIVYAVRFMYFWKVLIKRKKKHEKN
jgi:hypothetical protein